MDVALSIFGVAFAAFSVWLTVRIVNRGERWAKRTAVGLVVLLAYPLSFGPACWISSRAGARAIVDIVYQPIPRLWWNGRPPMTDDIMDRYTRFAAAPGCAMLLFESGDYGWGPRP